MLNQVNWNKGPIAAIPPTTDLVVVFPYDKSRWRFDRGFYSPLLTDGRMNSDQLESFLTEAERSMRKKLKSITIALACYVLFVIMGFLGLVSMITDDDYMDDDDLDDITTLMLVYFCAVIFGGIFLQFYIKRRQVKARRRVESLINRNSAIFAVQGLRWNVPLFFPQWIELWKEYRGYPVNNQPAFQAFNGMIPQQQTQIQYSPVVPNAFNNFAKPQKQVYPSLDGPVPQNLRQDKNHYYPPLINPAENYDN